MLKKVTITGADDSVVPEQLRELSEQFPFVEWGILVSRKHFGYDRFPSKQWIEELHNFKGDMQLSAHLCGAFVKEYLLGLYKCTFEFTPLWEIVQRVQLNTHGMVHEFRESAFQAMLLENKKEFIFQNDNVNDELLFEAKKFQVNCSTLFDMSHGAGVLPKDWPVPFVDVRCGYAGGLSPDNLQEQILAIETAAAGTEIWIDMETHVRTGRIFNLAKVRRCLEISAEHISK